MRVAAWQFDVRRAQLDANLETALGGVRRAAEAGAELVVLPEMWPTSFVDTTEPGGEGDALEATRRALEAMSGLSAELDLAVCGTAFAPVPGALPVNRLHVIDAGREVLSYDKLHLFTPTAERESFSAGAAAPPVVGVRGARLSGVICYDLRFPEPSRAAWRGGAEILLVPAQWPRPRDAHFRALVVGRAVEGQCFVVGVNRCGSDVIGRRRMELDFPGNSLIVDPHGQVLDEGRGEAALLVADLDLDLARQLRRRVPTGKDERPEVYRSWQ